MRLVFIFIFIIFSIKSFSQLNVDMVDLKQRIDSCNNTISLDNIIRNNLRAVKNKDFSNVEVNLFHIYYLYANEELKKDDFIKDDFLKNLKPICFKKKSLIQKRKKYPKAQTFIFTNGGELLVYAENGQIYDYNNEALLSTDESLIKFYLEKKIYLAFRLSNTNLSIHFGVSDDSIYVIEQLNNKINYYPIVEFVNCFWDKLMYMNP